MCAMLNAPSSHQHHPAKLSPAHSAGVLPVCGKHMLLGRETRGWSAFSGKGLVDETPVDTACRELREETANLIDLEPEHIATGARIVSSTPRHSQFYLYVVSLDQFDPDINDKFWKCRRQSKRGVEREKKELKWVPLKDVAHMRLMQSFRSDLQAILHAAATLEASSFPCGDDSPSAISREPSLSEEGGSCDL